MTHVLGISAFYHDSAAALLRDGRIVGAAQEERFSRRKNDERFPGGAIAYCLEEGRISAADLDAVVFYDKPITKFARMVETYLAVAPGGWRTFPRIVPSWFGEKLNIRRTIRDEIPGLKPDCPIRFSRHHQAHAASAFYPSPFEEAAILTVDGVGEWATTAVGVGIGTEIENRRELRFPHSLGLLYSAFTAYCGFRVNSGEYKLMGLAPYGEPRFVEAIRAHLIDLKDDGSFRLNLEYFGFLSGTRMTNRRFHRLFGGEPRKPETEITARHMDVARSIQDVTTEVMLRLARYARDSTGMENLCLAGGVALNCVANGMIAAAGIFDRIWIQPAAGDAGGALGAALAYWYEGRETGGAGARIGSKGGEDSMDGALLGPAFSDDRIEAVLDSIGAVYERLECEALLSRTVELLAAEKVVGWFQGRLEFGTRALGNRSILGDARSPRLQSVMNRKIKFRESFRPFAPIVRRERAAEYFDLDLDSPYMLLVGSVREDLRREAVGVGPGLARVNSVRSTIPAVTHVDYSARIQTVTRESNELLYRLLERFERLTGCGVLINTSFNVRGEPIVATPDDAYRCFVNTEMDYLVIGSFLLERRRQNADVVLPRFEPVPD